MEHPVEQPCNWYVRLCGKKKRKHCVNILKIKIYHMILVYGIQYINDIILLSKLFNLLWKNSYLVKFILFSVHRYTHCKWVNWCNIAMLPWKNNTSYIPTSEVIRSCSYVFISLKTSYVFQFSISNEMFAQYHMHIAMIKSLHT